MLDGLTNWLKVGRVTEDVGWTNKVAESRKSDRSTDSDERQRFVEGHDRLRYRAEHLIGYPT